MPKYEKNPDAVAALTSEQFRVTQENGTERPWTGAHLDNKEVGIYVDIVSGEPLFASSDKYESGCGWPSFTKPIDPAYMNELTDNSLGMTRIEVRSNSSPAQTWLTRAMATTLIKWRILNDGTCCTGWWLFLGHGRSDPQTARRYCNPRWLHRWRYPQCNIPQTRHPCRRDRNHVRPNANQLSAAIGVLLSNPRPHHDQPPRQRSWHVVSVSHILCG